MAKVAKIKRTFSLDYEVNKQIEQLAKAQNLTLSETLTRAIKLYKDALDANTTINDNNSALVLSLQAHIKDLQNQVSVKDAQISALNENLKAQQTISALITPNLQKQLNGAGAGDNIAPRPSIFTKLFKRKKDNNNKENEVQND